MFRAIDTKGNEVEGWLLIIDGVYVIAHKNESPLGSLLGTNVFTIAGKSVVFIEVQPQSLAMKTGVCDKNKKPIYGSFPVDGAMSKGGDIVRFSSTSGGYEWPIRVGEVFYKTEGSIDYCFRVEKEGNFGLNSNDVECYEIIGTQWDGEDGIR